MKPCEVCKKDIRKKDSVMTAVYVCSLACKELRKNRLPKKLSVVTKEYWINKGHTEEEAKVKVSALQRLRSTRCVEYWINKGHTEEEAKVKVSEVQASNSKIRMLKTTKQQRRAASPFCREYWINKGHTEEEAIQILVKNSDNTSLIYYTNRYGTKIGTQQYNKMRAYRKKSI